VYPCYLERCVSLRFSRIAAAALVLLLLLLLQQEVAAAAHGFDPKQV
jgi:hypothetical protein